MQVRAPVAIQTSPSETVDLSLTEKVERERLYAKLRLVWGNRRVLVRLAGIALLLSTLTAFLIPPRYSSQVQIMPPSSQSSNSLASTTLTMMAGLAGQVGGLGAFATDLFGMKSTGALFVGVLQSQTVQKRIVDRFDLKKVYGVRLRETARQKLAESTGVNEDRKSGIIALTVTDRDAKRAAAMASAYVDELDTMMAQLSTSSARRERIFLEQRLTSVKADLEAAEKDFSQFATKNATVDITEQSKAMVGAAATLEGQLIAAQSELEGLKQIYTDNNVRVRATEARIAELRNQLQKFSGKAEPAFNPDTTPSTELYPSLRKLPVLGVPYADLLRRLKIQEAVYETLTKEYELARVQEAKEIPTVKVLDSAEVPERRSYPPRLLVIFVGTFFSVIMGIGWIIGKSRWQEIETHDPGKIFVSEVAHDLRRLSPFGNRNGHNSDQSDRRNGDKDS